MREIFYEESAKIIDDKPQIRKFNTCHVISIICFVCAILWAMMVYFMLDLRVFEKGNIIIPIVLVVMPFLVFIGGGILFTFYKKRFHVEYDYTFVSGSLRFSKVIKNYKRKALFQFDTQAIERIGKYGSETFSKYQEMPGIKKHILTSNKTPAEGKKFYYIIANAEGEKKLIIIESTELLLVNILKFSRRTVLEEGFTK